MTSGQLGFGWSSTVAVGLLLMNQWLIWKAPWTCSWSFWDSGQSVLDLEFPFYLQTYWTLVLVMKVGAEIWNLFSFASLALSLIDTSHLSKLVGKAWFILVHSLLQQGHFLTFLIYLSPCDQFQPLVTLINTFKFWATPAIPRAVCLSSAPLQHYRFAICLQFNWIWVGVWLWKLFYLLIWVNGTHHHSF